MAHLDIDKITSIFNEEKSKFNKQLQSGEWNDLTKLSDDINRFKNILAFLFLICGGGEGALYLLKKNPLQIIQYYKENIGDFNLVSTQPLYDYGNGLHPILIPYFNSYLVYYKMNLSLLSAIEYATNISDENS